MWFVVGKIFLFIVILYLALCLFLFFMQSKLLYYPTKDVPAGTELLRLNYQDVNFVTADNIKLHGIYTPGNKGGYTVLYCHGNGGNVNYYLDIGKIYNDLLGLGYFLFDYRGYGKSEGKPSEEGTYADAAAAYKWLTDDKKIPPEKIILVGWSLGAPIAAKLASEVKAGGLVIEGSFTSYVNMGKKLYPYLPIKLFAKYDYNALEYIKKVKIPVMVMHSIEDEMIPFEFGKELFDAANQPKKFVELKGGHNDAQFSSEETYEQAWKQWLESIKQN